MWEECECGRGSYDAENYNSCYECFLDRRADYLQCIWCGRWHSPAFDSCYRCRQNYDRREASLILRQLILDRDGYRCRMCRAGVGTPQYDPLTGTQVFATLQVDHIKPCAKGGTADEWNLQVLCGVCNRAKGAQWHPRGPWGRMRIRMCRYYLLIAPTYFGDAERDRFMAEVQQYQDQGVW